MTDLHKNKFLEKIELDFRLLGILNTDHAIDLFQEFHDRLTKLEAIANITCLVESHDGRKPSVTTEPHLGMIDLEAFSKLQAENMDLRQQIVKLSNMFWDEVKASTLWKQKYETSYNELRALKMNIK